MGNAKLKVECYANDTILIDINKDVLQMFYANIMCKRAISTANTNAMNIAATPVSTSKLVVDGKVVEQIMEAVYLGVTVTTYVV